MRKVTITILVSVIITVAFAQAENLNISKGSDLYRQGKYDQAEQEYRQALLKNPANENAKHNLANSLMKQQKFQEAQEIYDQLTRSSDKLVRSVAYYNTGVAFTKQKELESSIDAYKSALRNNPDDVQARENLQKALSELKKKQSQNQSSSSSNMSNSQAEDKLKQLQAKEKEVQKRMQNQKQGQGGTSSKDW